jgi:hypothetical protein
VAINGLLLKTRKASMPHTKPFHMGRISGFCVFLVRAVEAETTRSGAIANDGYIAIRRTHCNHGSRRMGAVGTILALFAVILRH